MVRTPWITYLWPGLPQLWCQGLWRGLLLAIVAGFLLNTLLLATLVWSEWLGSGVFRLAWCFLILVWVGSAVGSAWYSGGVVPRRVGSADELFRQALGEYLQENWFEAERILIELLRFRPTDVEARLQLATLLRHNRRYDEATEQLAHLKLLRGAASWSREIEVERRAIIAAVAAGREQQTAGSQSSEMAARRAAEGHEPENATGKQSTKLVEPVDEPTIDIDPATDNHHVSGGVELVDPSQNIPPKEAGHPQAPLGEGEKKQLSPRRRAA